MICFLSNHYFANRNSEISFLITPAFASTGKKPDANGILTSLSYKSKNDLSHQEKRILKKEFLKQCIRYVKAGSTGDSRVAAEAFEVMATIVAALGVLYLLAGLACSLSCSGSEGLAVLVTILGISGVVFGSVALMQTIFKTKKKNPS